MIICQLWPCYHVMAGLVPNNVSAPNKEGKTDNDPDTLEYIPSAVWHTDTLTITSSLGSLIHHSIMPSCLPASLPKVFDVESKKKSCFAGFIGSIP